MPTQPRKAAQPRKSAPTTAKTTRAASAPRTNPVTSRTPANAETPEADAPSLSAVYAETDPTKNWNLWEVERDGVNDPFMYFLPNAKQYLSKKGAAVLGNPRRVLVTVTALKD